MAKTINGITFTKLSKIGIGSAFNNVINGDIRSESDLQDYIDANEEYKNIQSVLIDWNGAQLGTVNGLNLGTIDTTGQLLTTLKTIANAIPDIAEITNQLNTMNSYIVDYGAAIANIQNDINTLYTYVSSYSYSGGSIVTTYNITWDDNGATTPHSGGSSIVEVGQSVTLPTTNPTRTGYNFIGWAKTRTATSANVSSSTVPTANTTYYAVWEPIGQNYYWYVGQTNPANMTTIDPIVNDMTSPGWRLIGTSIPTYSSSNKLFNADSGNIITTGTSLATQYIAIPASSSACPRDGAGNDASTVDMYTREANITINGILYKVYATVGKSKKLAINIY